jgi:tRNA pseudouridine13 synthase
MKVKRLREDFVVKEVTQFPLSGGTYATYSLEKCGLGTPEAIQEILKVWNLPRHHVGYGGLKDRHAITSQIITIQRGPPKDIQQRSFSLNYLGQAPRPFEAKDIQANAFEVTLRDLTHQQAESISAACQALGAGIPNYFDDQRFGSLGDSGQFVAHPWCLGDYERALFLAIAEFNSHDRPREREQKELLRTHWGQWLECKRLLDRSHRRSIVTYLCDHPTDFKRAIALIRIDLRSIYVAAFQSQLWNQILAAWWRQNLADDQLTRVSGVGSELLFPIQLSDALAERARNLHIPLPSARQRDWDAELLPLVDSVLQPYKIQRHEIRLKYPRDTFFSKGARSAMLVPEALQVTSASDELAKQRQKLTLSFRLHRGQYATMVVKHMERIAGTVHPAS